MKLRNRSISLLAEVSALAALVFTSSCAKESAGVMAADQTTTIVPVTKVARSNMADNLVLTGEFIPYQEIDVMAKEAGYIKTIRVDIGTGCKLASCWPSWRFLKCRMIWHEPQPGCRRLKQIFQRQKGICGKPNRAMRLPSCRTRGSQMS